MKDLTPPQLAALRAVIKLSDTLVGTARVRAGSATAHAVARELWPDSAAWDKRPRRTDGRSGGSGATMPMKAGRLLWRLRDCGVVSRTKRAWAPTEEGRKMAARPGAIAERAGEATGSKEADR